MGTTTVHSNQPATPSTHRKLTATIKSTKMLIKPTTKPSTKSTTRRTTHAPTTKRTTKPTTKRTTKSTTRRTTHAPSTKRTTKSSNKPTTKTTTRRTTHAPTTKRTPKPTTRPTTRRRTTRRTTHAPTTKRTPKPTTRPTTKRRTTRRTTHAPTTKRTPKPTNRPTTRRRTTRRTTHAPTTKRTTKSSNKPTTKTTTRRTTHAPTTKRTPKPTTKPTTKRRSTRRTTHAPTTKRTPKPTTKPTTKRRTTKTTTHAPTTKRTPKPITKPTTKRRTTRRTTHAPTTKRTPKPTTKPTTKRRTTRRTTHAPTTKRTTKSSNKPTTKTTTRRTTHAPTTKRTPKPTTRPTTKRRTTRRTTHAPTTKQTPKPTTKPTTKRRTTRRTTHAPTTKRTPKPTTKSTTKRRTTRRTTHAPTTKRTPKPTTKPTTKRRTTRRTTHSPTTKRTPKPTTKPATKRRTTRRTTHAPTTKRTPKPTTKPTTKRRTTRRTTHAPTTKRTPKPTTKPTTKRRTTRRTSHAPTTKRTPKPTTKPTTKRRTTKRTTHAPTTKRTPKPSTKPTTKRRTTRRTTRAPTTKRTPKPTTKPTTKRRTTRKTTHAPTTKRTPKPTTKPTTKRRTTRKTTHAPTTKRTPRPTTSTKQTTRRTRVSTRHTTPQRGSTKKGHAPEDALYDVDDTSVVENIPAEDSVGTTPRSFPKASDNYQVEVEANIIDKGYTVDAKLYYDYLGNRAALTLAHKDSYESWTKYIYNYATDEIFTVTSGQDRDCSVEKLTTSRDIYSTWLFGFTTTDNGLHITYPTWQIGFEDETDYEAVYLGNGSVRGISVDHWQGCGRFEVNSTMLVDYYFAHSWNTAWNYPRVPVRIEVMADKQLANGSLYSLHHIYDFFDYQPYLENDPSIFQTPKGVICPGRKNTRPAPVLPQDFYYRVEVINTDQQLMTYEDIWYDACFGHYRKDYRPLVPQYPTYTTNPITEIHDYHIGARYVIDKTLGNCSILPLTNTSGEALPRMNSENAVKSYIISLKNPLQLFDMTWNYTYIGQSWQRGILCDVYVTEHQNLLVTGFSASVTTTITVYFLAKEWLDYVNLGPDYTIQTPVKMELNADEIAVNTVYNYLDFTADRPFLDVFDISPCFSEKDKLKFEVRFPGNFMEHTSQELTNIAHTEFAGDLGVNILRVQEIGLEYDDQYLYVSAVLLDRPPPPALFEYVPGKVTEKEDDVVVFNVSVPMQCPGFCVNNKDFVCNSYDFCSYRVGDQYSYECRLSRAHSSEGVTLSNSKTCDHFTRSVNGAAPEPNITDAYRNLRESVYNQSVILYLPNPYATGFPGPDPFMTEYTATDISINFGWLTSKKKLPVLGDYFHYRIEVSIPATRYTYEGEIWYDKTLQLIREEFHVSQPVAPYYTTNPLTIIEDFSTGLQYRIDRTGENCSVQAIPVESHGAILTNTDPYQANSSWSLRIRTPNELLHIDDTYKFVGQQTVRGVLCNVFESRRTDYKLPTVQGDYETSWRYFFLADNWYEVSEESGGAHSIPIRLEVTVTDLSTFVVFDFYDFNNDQLDISQYDVHQCYNATKQTTFQITFPGQFHPYLDTKTDLFRLESVFSLSRITGLEPLRFQRTRIDYDIDNIYITTTMVDQANVLDYYTNVVDGGVVVHPDVVFDSSNTGSIEDCARACYNADFLCNSFYYCDGTERQCLLSKGNVPNGPDAKRDPGCKPFSRTVTAKIFAPPSVDQALVKLKNNVYRRKLWLEIYRPLPLELHRYTATIIRTDIIGTIDYTDQDAALQKFSVFRNNTKTTVFDNVLENLSVGDCAEVCRDITEYQCEGFSYCYDQLDCWLLKTRPENISVKSTANLDSCYIYQRTYLDEYMPSPGPVTMTYADLSYWPKHTVEDCAKACTLGRDFKCKSFEYCPSTNECLVFKGRTLGLTKSDPGPDCSYYTRGYLIDFEPTNVTGNFLFSSDVQFLQVTTRQCAELCVEQQGSSCHGFYFCAVKRSCHIMLVQSQANPVFGTTGENSQEILCTFFAKTDIKSATVPSTSVASFSRNLTTQSTLSTTQTSTASPSTSPTSTSHTRETFRMLYTHTMWWPKSTTQTISMLRGTSTGILPTPLHQTDDNDNNKNSTGTVIGVAFATFLLGLIIGAVSFHMFNKHPAFHGALHCLNTRKGEDDSSDKDNRAIEMDFTKLEETR